MEEWLAEFLSSQRPNIPLPVLVQTASFRLLASDITRTLVVRAANCFPEGLNNVHIKERIVRGPIPVQVLSVEDMSKSRWEQIEAIEALERGEQKKGREIIRATNVEENDDTSNNAASITGAGSGGPHKLLLQDANGSKAWAIEHKTVRGVDLSISIGAKIVLKNVLVARGFILMQPINTAVLGGKIEEMHKAWKEGRKVELRTQIAASESND